MFDPLFITAGLRYENEMNSKLTDYNSMVISLLIAEIVV